MRPGNVTARSCTLLKSIDRCGLDADGRLLSLRQRAPAVIQETLLAESSLLLISKAAVLNGGYGRLVKDQASLLSLSDFMLIRPLPGSA